MSEVFRRVWFEAPRGGQPVTLLELLAERLPAALDRPLTRAAVRKLIKVGAVRVGGRALVEPGHLLRPGTRIEARVRLDRLAPAASGVAFRLDTGSILHDDGVLLVVAKPAGVPMHATADRSRADFTSGVREWQAAAARRSGRAPYLATHQRLDRDTSGVVVFCTDPGANAALSAAFAGREVAKRYLALVRVGPEGAPEGAWAVRLPLTPQGTGRRARMTPAAGGQPAETVLRVLRKRAGVALVEAEPRTGRKHQVRAHLAASGLPILGDERYGGPAALAGVRFERGLLHALSLRLRHPRSGQELCFEAPPPADFRAAERELLGPPAARSGSRR